MLTRHDIGRPLMSSFVSPPPVVQPIYKDQIEAYFAHYDIELTWKVINGGEIHKNMEVGENPLLHQPMGSHLAVREADLGPPPPPLLPHTTHTAPFLPSFCLPQPTDHARDRRRHGLLRYRPHRAHPRHRRRIGDRCVGLRLCLLSPIEQFHPGSDDSDRFDRRERQYQGGVEP